MNRNIFIFQLRHSDSGTNRNVQPSSRHSLRIILHRSSGSAEDSVETAERVLAESKVLPYLLAQNLIRASDTEPVSADLSSRQNILATEASVTKETID